MDSAIAQYKIDIEKHGINMRQLFSQKLMIEDMDECRNDGKLLWEKIIEIRKCDMPDAKKKELLFPWDHNK